MIRLIFWLSVLGILTALTGCNESEESTPLSQWEDKTPSQAINNGVTVNDDITGDNDSYENSSLCLRDMTWKSCDNNSDNSSSTLPAGGGYLYAPNKTQTIFFSDLSSLNSGSTFAPVEDVDQGTVLSVSGGMDWSYVETLAFRGIGQGDQKGIYYESYSLLSFKIKTFGVNEVIVVAKDIRHGYNIAGVGDSLGGGWYQLDIPLSDFVAGYADEYNSSPRVAKDTGQIAFLVEETFYITDVAFSGEPDASVLKSGIFLDSAVEGLYFESGTQSGTTGASGNFTYVDGAKVEFSVGGVVLGKGYGKEMMTPLDLVEGADNTTNEIVIRIAQFLQSLDEDNDPINGISISDATAQTLAALTFNIQESTDFEIEAETILGMVGKTLVSTDAAKAHLDEAVAETTALPKSGGYLFAPGRTQTIFYYSIDEWSTGTSFGIVTDNDQGTVMAVTPGDGWGTVLAFWGIGLSDQQTGDMTKVYSQVSFKIKSNFSGITVYVSGIRSPDNGISITDGIALGNDWYEVTVSFTDLTRGSASADGYLTFYQVGSESEFYITDILLSP